MAKKSLREELESVTKIKRKRGEKDIAYRARLVRHCADLSEDDWESLGLTDGAQKWVIQAIDDMNDNKDPEEFPDEESEGGTEEGKPRSRSPAKKSAAKRSAPKDKAKGSGKTKVERDDFGLKVGTKASEAAALFAKGAKMKDVKETTGTTHYNLLTNLEKKGHKVTKEDGVITLTVK
ncbi:hypothetical protein LCGC14_0231630 [marine sediment metagenome]|uniref:Uncharacterized protein n=1 Tax=marine sediment metagenome TaxID=412755 RepID=A0A0F9UA30_9ZZZZ